MPDKKSPVISRRHGARIQRPKGSAPRVTHGTQVRFNVICTRCRAEDTLPFVPKTQNEVLCRRCAEEVFGEDWAHGRELPEEPESHAFKCAKCGRVDYVPFEPRPDSELFCQACLRGEEQPRNERLKRMKRIE